VNAQFSSLSALSVEHIIMYFNFGAQLKVPGQGTEKDTVRLKNHAMTIT
jgi:hypothetical protein